MGILRQLSGSERVSGAEMCRALFDSGLFPGTLILTLRSFNPLSLGRGCDSRIDHYLVDRVPRLGDDKLQVHVRIARDHDSLGSGAVRVHGVGARAWAPTRCEVAANGNCVNLREVSVTIKRLLGKAIHEQGRSVWEDYASVDGKGVAASDGGIAAIAGVGHQRRRHDQSKCQEKRRVAEFHGVSRFSRRHVYFTPSL
jgi:hypothetical protein